MASDIENCTKFLEVDTHRIGLYHKYFDSGSGRTDKYLLYKRGSTQMWEMSIGMDDNRNVSLGFISKSNELTDINDIHKFDLVVDKEVWNCSSKVAKAIEIIIFFKHLSLNIYLDNSRKI